MCGIAGSFCPLRPVALLGRGAELAAQLAHRGPDARGIWQAPDGRAQLVHTRLSIIDVADRSNQPFVRPRTITVFNGEIYNYRELRRELLQRGEIFATEGDTEVVAVGFEHWGNGLFQRLQGMYAIGIYEPEKSQLTLARDMFGIKPLYYGVWDGELRFGSEMKALLIDQTPQLNEPILWDLATFGFHFDHESIWQRIVHLPPGQVLEVSRGASGLNLTIHEAKRLDARAAETPTQRGLVAVLADSVRDHLLADVPVATSLSGGLDSSLVTALAHRRSPGITAYTNSFAALGDPEVQHAELLCRSQGIPHRIIESRITRPVDLFDRICWHLEEPVPNIGLVTSYFLGSALCDEGYKVVLIGEGADELFAGYPWHALALARPGDESGSDLFRAYRQRRSQLPANQWLRPKAAERLQARVADQERRFAACLAAAECSHLGKFLAFSQRYQLEFSQLLRVDRLFMAHGVEARVPYLYDGVAAAANGLPDHQRIAPLRWGRLHRWLDRGQLRDKIGLRHAAQTLVPPAIAARPKFGKRGTANLHGSAVSQAVGAYFQGALASARHAAARELLGELFDWQRMARATEPLSSKQKLFLSLLIGTTSHALNQFRWSAGDAYRGASQTTCVSHNNLPGRRRAA